MSGALSITILGLTAGIAVYSLVRFFAKQGRVRVQNGVLIGPGVAYNITSEDVLWLGRAVYGETGGVSRRACAAVIWAIAQNHALVLGPAGTRPRLSSFTATIRAYCQPVNPAWSDPDGEKCRTSPGACTPDRIARRREVQSMPFSALPSVVREAVGDFLDGSLENPVSEMVDWAAYMYEGARVQIGGNWFGVAAGRRLA